MTTETKTLIISGIKVEIVRKDIKNLHLGVYPPQGRVRVAAPLVVSDEAIRLAVIEKLGWIRRKQAAFQAQPRQSAREMVSGESHYYRGQRYRLRVHEQVGRQYVEIRGNSILSLYVNAKRTTEQRQAVLDRWYRQELKTLIQPLLEKWQSRLGVVVGGWGVRCMKTKWGSCNPKSRRVWFNLELAKKPVQSLEYIVVHELLHLLERQHTQRFKSLLETHFPLWQQWRDVLNRMPLSS